MNNLFYKLLNLNFDDAENCENPYRCIDERMEMNDIQSDRLYEQFKEWRND
jgi:hypothetical protein